MNISFIYLPKQNLCSSPTIFNRRYYCTTLKKNTTKQWFSSKKQNISTLDSYLELAKQKKTVDKDITDTAVFAGTSYEHKAIDSLNKYRFKLKVEYQILE